MDSNTSLNSRVIARYIEHQNRPDQFDECVIRGRPFTADPTWLELVRTVLAWRGGEAANPQSRKDLGTGGTVS
jgi:hypothetical protein